MAESEVTDTGTDAWQAGYRNGYDGASNDHGARDDTASAVLTMVVGELRGYIDSLPDGRPISSTNVIISLSGLLNLASQSHRAPFPRASVGVLALDPDNRQHAAWLAREHLRDDDMCPSDLAAETFNLEIDGFQRVLRAMRSQQEPERSEKGSRVEPPDYDLTREGQRP